MDYNNNNYRNNADCDPADCNYRTDRSPEFASDFIVETGVNNPDGLLVPPVEYQLVVDAENSEEFDPQKEQAATDYYNNFDGAYGATDLYESDNYEDSSDYQTETAEEYGIPYDTETSEEFSEDYDCDGRNCNPRNDVDYNVTDDYDPSDETAATIDEWYTTDKPSARERCELDDYEIISDVLGSEKQIVKLYSTALCEASEEPFRNLLRENLDEAAADQYKAFEFMQKRGMYQTEQASEQKISEAKQQFSPLCRNCGCDTCCD